jgi:membrane AbrB-like protein
VLILVTFGIALAGGLIAIRLKVPAGAMIGAMVAVGLFNVLADSAVFPNEAKLLTQTISGLFIGCKINKSELRSLKKTLRPALLNVVLILLFCLGMGVVLYQVTDYSLATCTFSTAPGSLVDMAIISIDMGADPSVVSVLQLVRLVSILGLFPLAFQGLIKKWPPAVVVTPDEPVSAAPPTTMTVPRIGLTLLIGALGGLIGYALGIPAGALLFAMLTVSLLNIFTNRACTPFKVKQFAQICAGTLIGTTVNLETMIHLKSAIIPALLMMIGLFVAVVLLAL